MRNCAVLPAGTLRNSAARRAEMAGSAFCGQVMTRAALLRADAVEISAFAVEPGLAQRMGCLAEVTVMARNGAVGVAAV